MKILSFDTSTRALSLALAEHHTIIRYRNLRSMKFLSSSIMPAIQGILKAAGWTLEDLDGLIVGLGPGSFTSLRVGISSARAISFALGIPVAGVCSLDAVAMNVRQDGPVAVINDARRGLVYARIYEKKGTILKPAGDCVLDKPQAVIRNVSPETTVIGDALNIYQPLLKPFTRVVEDQDLFYPDARHLVTLGLKALQDQASASGAEDPLNPIYLYPEDCQVSKKS